MSVSQAQHDALYRIDTMVIEDLREQLRLSQEEFRQMLSALLSGELQLYGCKVRVEVTWPDGPPFSDLTSEQLLTLLLPFPRG